MKNSTIFSFFLLFYCFDSVAQQTCEQRLEELRNEGIKLSEANIELKKSNDALRKLYTASARDKVLDKQVRDWQQQLAKVNAEKTHQANIIIDRDLRIKQLRSQGKESARLYVTLYDERKAASDSVFLQGKRIESLERNVAQKQDSIRELKKEINDYRRLIKELDDEDKDRVYVNSQFVVFAGAGCRFGQTIFTVHYKKSDKEFRPADRPSEEDEAKVARFVKLFSKYSDRIKIHLIVGSRLDDNGYRISREADLRRYMKTFPAPMNLNELDFSRPNMINVSNYDIQIQIVRR